SMRSEQVVVETRAGGCGAPSVPITFKYTIGPGGFDYSRTMRVPVGAEPSRVYFTVYETGANSPPPHHFAFDAIEAPAQRAACVARVARFADPDAFPLLIPAVLPAGWQRLPLHQRLAALERPAIGVAHD